MGCLIEDQKTKSKNGHNSEKRCFFELSPWVVRFALWIVNTYSKFRVKIFSNNRYYKMAVFARRRLQGYILSLPGLPDE